MCPQWPCGVGQRGVCGQHGPIQNRSIRFCWGSVETVFLRKTGLEQRLPRVLCVDPACPHHTFSPRRGLIPAGQALVFCMFLVQKSKLDLSLLKITYLGPGQARVVRGATVNINTVNRPI